MLSIQRRQTLSLASDALLISGSILVPSALYLGGLGFYSDDWRFISVMHSAGDQSLPGLVQSLSSDLLARPPQLLMVVVLFKWFGLVPLGYHVANNVVLALGVVCFYLVLRQIGVARPLAVSVAAVYGALPHYSTDRLWLASSQATLGMALFFAGTYALLRGLRSERWWVVYSSFGALLLTGSALSYEVFVPAVGLASPTALLASSGRQRMQLENSRRLWLLISLSIAITAGVVLFKLAVSTRIPEFPSLLGRARWFAAVLRDGVVLSYGQYGVGLPATAVVALWRWPDGLRVFVAAIIGGLIGVYARALSKRDNLSHHQGRLLAVIGPLLFLVGVAIFTTNYAFLATPSGNGNRVMIGAAVGVAVTFVGILAWSLEWSGFGRHRHTIFATLVGAVCFSGIVINTTLADFWVRATREQVRIVGTIRSAVPIFPRGSTLLLYGVCPYDGPGIVYESSWDLASVLQLTYNDASVRADVVSPRLSIGEEGVSTIFYGESSFYPYAMLLLLDARTGAVMRVSNANSLRILLGDSTACAGSPGEGAPIF